jgi:hypothetical protein
MAAYFPPESKHYYYQSEKFSQILQYVQMNPTIMRLKQTGNNLSLLAQPVNTIQHALHILRRMNDSIKIVEVV